MREKESARKEESHENKAEVFTQEISEGRKAFTPFEFVTEYAVDHKVDTAIERYLDDLQM